MRLEATQMGGAINGGGAGAPVLAERAEPHRIASCPGDTGESENNDHFEIRHVNFPNPRAPNINVGKSDRLPASTEMVVFFAPPSDPFHASGQH